MTATHTETTVITDDTPTATVLEVIEARTRRLMAELARTPDAWPTRQARQELAREVDDSLVEFNRLSLGR